MARPKGNPKTTEPKTEDTPGKKRRDRWARRRIVQQVADWLSVQCLDEVQADRQVENPTMADVRQFISSTLRYEDQIWDESWRRTGMRRTASCGRCVVSDDGMVRAKVKEGVAYWDGLATCASVWLCERCRVQILGGRQRQLLDIEEQHRATGGKVSMATFTMRHHAHMSLAEVKDTMRNAWRSFTQSAAWRDWNNQWVGTVKAVEVTTTLGPESNGWHFHFHVVLYWSAGASRLEHRRKIKAFERWAQVAWANRVERQCGLRPSWRGVHVADLRVGDTGYVAKIGAEVTGTAYKTSDALRVLTEACEAGDAVAVGKLAEFAREMRGVHSVRISTGLKGAYKVAELTDEELAAEVLGGTDVGGLTRPQYRNAYHQVDDHGVPLPAVILDSIEATGSHPMLLPPVVVTVTEVEASPERWAKRHVAARQEYSPDKERRRRYLMAWQPQPELIHTIR